MSSDILVSSGLRLRSNDGFDIDFERGFERLENSFVVDEAEILPGDYVSNDFSIRGRTNSSRPLSANGGITLAEFFGGDRTIYSAGIGVRTGKYLNFEANLDHNAFDLPVENGKFDATTFTLSINAAQSRKLFAKALVQYDNFSRDLQANIRIDWIHSPGADLFVVFNTNYNFTGEEDQFDFRNASLNNQVGVAKLTYVIQL